MYSIPIDVDLNNEIAFADRDSLTDGATTATDWEIVKVVEEYKLDSDDMKNESCPDVPEMGNSSALLRVPKSE